MLAPAFANDACVDAGGTLTCSGDQSGGVAATNPPDSTVKVTGLTGDITPVGGVAGIVLTTSQANRPISIESLSGGDVGGPFGIDTIDAAAIRASSQVILNTSSAIALVGGDISIETDRALSAANAFGIDVSLRLDATTNGVGSPAEISGGAISISSTGSIGTTRSSAAGIWVSATSNAVADGMGDAKVSGPEVNIVSGGVSTYGPNSVGIAVFTNSSALTSGGGSAYAQNSGISLTVSGPVTTETESSIGIFLAADTTVSATGAVAVAHAGVVTADVGDITVHGDSSTALAVSNSSFAGNQGVGSAEAVGGSVSVTHTGTLTTTGFATTALTANNNAQAFVAGGTGATATGAAMTIETGAISTTQDFSTGMNVFNATSADTSGVGNASAVGGTVSVSAGSVSTQGQGSTAMWVVSSTLANASAGTAEAREGQMSIVATDISTIGGSSHGIDASSTAILGSGVGTSRSGDIEITTSGVIKATGASSIGIRAQSEASGGTAVNGDITVNVVSGSVTGNSIGINLIGGSENRINNAGNISAISKFAISGGVGNETVINTGTITGNVYLGAGNNKFVNEAAGIYYSGDFLSAGGQGASNAGLLSAGGAGLVQTTAVTGDFVQTPQGKFAVDADWTGDTADKLIVSGAATLAGTVIVIPNHFPMAGGLSHEFLILHADAGVTDDGIAALDMAAAHYALLFDANGVDVYLKATINIMGFGTAGLNGNETSVARNINDALDANAAGPIDPVVQALISLPGGAGLAAALDQLSPEIYTDAALSGLESARRFTELLLSCHDGKTKRSGADGNCVWASVGGRSFVADRTFKQQGYKEETWSFAGGGQFNLASHIYLGLGAGFEQGDGDLTDGNGVDVARFNAGGDLKYHDGPVLLAVAVTGGHDDNDVTRGIGFAGFSSKVSGSQSTDHLGGRVHAAYQFGGDGLYLKPGIDVDVTRLWLGGVAEGGGIAALAIDSCGKTIVSTAPSVEVGSSFVLANGVVVHPLLRAGALLTSENELTVTSRFASLGLSTRFTTSTQVDDVMADVAAGIDISYGTAALKIDYDALIGPDTSEQSLSGHATVSF